MKNTKRHVRKHLETLRAVKRERHHHLIHKIHKKYRISKRTLFYVKEYGPHANVPKTIIKEGLRIMLFASLVSSIGGLTLEQIKPVFLSIIPLVILLPVMNGMIGGYGIIISSKFTTMLHEGRVIERWWRMPELKRMIAQVFIISLITAFMSTAIAFTISILSGFGLSSLAASKILLISMLDVVLLIGILTVISITAGLHFYRKHEDPNNFLIPITTSVTDFGNMIILSILVVMLF
jgi:cation transporter-like permease